MEEIEKQVDECQHHWIIDTPNGPTSQGKCKKCGISHEDLEKEKKAKLRLLKQEKMLLLDEIENKKEIEKDEIKR